VTNDVSAEHLLAALLDVWNSAKDGANTFCEQLLSEISSARSLIKSGGIASVGKNSAHQSYKSREPGTPTQGQTAEVYVQLLALYNQFKDKITQEFICSADFDNEVPAGFDFDAPIVGDKDPQCGLLAKTLMAVITGKAPQLPDIRELRIPLFCGKTNPAWT
jgi:hypothetical protein